MKHLFTMLFAMTLAIPMLAQDYEAVEDAFSDGNATALSNLFDATVEIDMLGKISSVGRGDAENKMRTFFMEHEPRNFDIVHKGVSQSDVHYCIAQLMTSDGVFRITLYLHKTGDRYLIHNIEIEEDND